MRFNQTVNHFRTNRGRLLQKQILESAQRLGRRIDILDIGGRADYWQNVGMNGVARVVLLNTSKDELGEVTSNVFEERIGDACNLSDYPDATFDLVHSNSVIEHVGGWDAMSAMASEAVRVGRSGWIQTPARGFPVEPHFHMPFVHWLSPAIRSRALKLSPISAFRRCSDQDRRYVVDSINLLSRRDLSRLFPGRDIYTETFVMPKSYVVRW